MVLAQAQRTHDARPREPSAAAAAPRLGLQVDVCDDGPRELRGRETRQNQVLSCPVLSSPIQSYSYHIISYQCQIVFAYQVANQYGQVAHVLAKILVLMKTRRQSLMNFCSPTRTRSWTRCPPNAFALCRDPLRSLDVSEGHTIYIVCLLFLLLHRAC